MIAMIKFRSILVIFLSVLCLSEIVAYESSVRIVSSDFTITDRDYMHRYWDRSFYSGRESPIFTRYGATGSDRYVSLSNFKTTGVSNLDLAFSKRKMSFSLTEPNDGGIMDQESYQEFGECPDFDTPVGDAIMPMLVLLGIFVGIRYLLAHLRP